MILCYFAISDTYNNTIFKPISSTAVYHTPNDGLTGVTNLQLTNISLIITGGTYANTYNLQPSTITNYTICDNEDSDCQSGEQCNASLVCEIGDAAPTVNLLSPADSTTYTISNTNLTVNFSCSATDDNLISNISFIIQDSVNATNISVNLASYTYNNSLTLPLGSYNWTCSATDNNSATTTATIRSFTIQQQQTPPTGGSGGNGDPPVLPCLEPFVIFNNECINATIPTNFVFEELPSSQCSQLSTFIKLQVLNNRQEVEDVDEVYMIIEDQNISFRRTLTGWVLSKILTDLSGVYDYTIFAKDIINGTKYKIKTNQVITITDCNLTTIDIAFQNTKTATIPIIDSTVEFFKNPIESTVYLWNKKPNHVVVIVLVVVSLIILMFGKQRSKNGKKTN